MTPERWEKLKQIFGDALEREPAEREAFVREAAQDDPDLLSDLLRLLEESDRDSKLLSRPALTRARPLGPDEGPRFAPETVLARRFRVVRFIAQGGMGEVYEAEDLELGGRVALKAIRRRIAPDHEMLALFKREIQLARLVTHPNVCRIFDLVQEEDAKTGGATMLLSMELLDGQTLSDHLQQHGPFTFRDALPLIEEIAAGLQAVHDAGIIHGDLKPGNVMLASQAGEPRPRAVVMDFGLASSAAQDSPDAALIRGRTPEYSAPEQADGSPLTTATDVYCLALIVADMLGVPRPARLKPDGERMPYRWARLLRRCLDAEPARRYARPADLATALRVSADSRRRIATKAGAALLVAAAAIWAGVYVRGLQNVARGMGHRLVWTVPRAYWAGVPAPDGRYMPADSNRSIILHDLATGKERALTQPPADSNEAAFTPVISWDGSKIAYSWRHEHHREVRTVNADGTHMRVLTNSNLLSR